MASLSQKYANLPGNLEARMVGKLWCVGQRGCDRTAVVNKFEVAVRRLKNRAGAGCPGGCVKLPGRVGHR